MWRRYVSHINLIIHGEESDVAINKTKFAEYDGKKVFSFLLSNGELAAEILNYGGIVKRLVYKGVDVVLGRDSMEEYLNNTGYFGALIGRNSNRIENSEFELSGKIYKLFSNNGRNNLHGGKTGFDKKIWDAHMIDRDEPSLVLSNFSEDGEEGFPGNLSVKVTYTLTKENSIKIHYEGQADSDTVLNMTNHTYFNLNGHSSGTVDEHSLWINSDFYTPNTEECMPNGEIISVADTPFDFNVEKTLGECFVSEHEQIKMFGGFDHNLVLNGAGFRKVAYFTGEKSKISMEVYTDRPGMQLYTGNKIEQNRMCKDGAFYFKHSGVCFETQAFPNSLNFSHFPNGILRKGENYDATTEYRFV